MNRFGSVWKVSGGCLDDSGYCVDGYHAKYIVETPMKEHWILFWLADSFYLNDPGLAIECSILGCLNVAWQMSGRCLGLFEWFWILSASTPIMYGGPLEIYDWLKSWIWMQIIQHVGAYQCPYCVFIYLVFWFHDIKMKTSLSAEIHIYFFSQWCQVAKEK